MSRKRSSTEERMTPKHVQLPPSVRLGSDPADPPAYKYWAGRPEAVAIVSTTGAEMTLLYLAAELYGLLMIDLDELDTDNEDVPAIFGVSMTEALAYVQVGDPLRFHVTDLLGGRYLVDLGDVAEVHNARTFLEGR